MSTARPDRCVSLLLAGIAGKRSVSDGFRIPILMYHSISATDEPGLNGYFQTNTRPEIFRQHMAYLSGGQYRSITLETLVEQMRSGGVPVEKQVVITFDDGYEDVYTTAYPVLAEHGLSADVFVPTRFLGSEGPGLNGRRHLSWKQVRELSDHGLTFGSHTVSHPRMTELDAAGITSELRDSKAEIEQRTGKSTASFAYPFDFPEQKRDFVARLVDALQANGYSAGTCTRIGTVHTFPQRYSLARVPANSGDDIRFFRVKVEGGYDWLRVPQSLYKTAKAMVRR